MNKKNYITGALLTLLATMNMSCSDEIEQTVAQGSTPLEIAAVMDGYADEDTKALVTGTSFPASTAIGVKVLNSSGSAYDGQTYKNIKFTSTGTGSSQTWAGASTVYLSNTSGKVYAYYPWADNTDMTAIAMSTGSGLATSVPDYMYATAATVSQTSRTASLTMNHALVAVTVTLTKGTYTGTGTVTSLKWTCAGAGQGGTLNAQTGVVTGVTGGGTAFDSGLTSTATQAIGTSKSYTFMAVPTGTAGQPTFTVVMDGQTFTAKGANITMAKGKHYKYKLTMDSKGLTVSSVTVTAWASQTAVTVKPTF